VKISEIKSFCTFEEAALAYIAQMPDDEVLTIRELAEKLGRQQPPNGRSIARLHERRLKISHGKIAYVYGNPKALRALRKKLSL
jgi:hypothetical protein